MKLAIRTDRTTSYARALVPYSLCLGHASSARSGDIAFVARPSTSAHHVSPSGLGSTDPVTHLDLQLNESEVIRLLAFFSPCSPAARDEYFSAVRLKVDEQQPTY